MFFIDNTQSRVTSFNDFLRYRSLGISSSVRSQLLLAFDVLLCALFTLLRVIRLSFLFIPTSISLFIWVYIGYNSYILDVLSWFRWNMYASERVVIFEAGLLHYTAGCEVLSVMCDYSVLFCATSTLYEAAFVTTSLANRVCLCLCVALCFFGESEITSLGVLDSSSIMVETWVTQELCHDAYDREHARHYGLHLRRGPYFDKRYPRNLAIVHSYWSEVFDVH